MKNHILRKAILGALGVAALSALSNQAMAFGGNAYDFGTFTGTTIQTAGSAPFKSWTDYGANVNLGWTHAASWATLQIGSASDINNGVVYNVKLTMSGAGTNGSATANTMDNPGFSVWTGGTQATSTDGSGFHAFNQVRGPSGPGETKTTNDALTSGGVLAGSNGWIGYANAGFVVTNSDGDTLNHGGVNNSNPWLTDPSASNWSYSQLNQINSSSALDFASLDLIGLKSGYYLLALGGSCGTQDPTTSCGTGQNYNFTVSTAPAPVPLPSAAWLMMGGLMTFLGAQKRKKTL